MDTDKKGGQGKVFIAKAVLGYEFYTLWINLLFVAVFAFGLAYLIFAVKPTTPKVLPFMMVFDFFLFLGLSYLVRALFFQSFHTIRIDSKKAVVETWYGAWLRRVNLSEIRSWYETDIDLPKVGRVHRLIIETPGNDWVIASSFYKDYDKLKMLLTLDKPHNRKIAGQIHFKQHRNVAIVQGVGSLVMSLMFFWLLYAGLTGDGMGTKQVIGLALLFLLAAGMGFSGYTKWKTAQDCRP